MKLRFSRVSLVAENNSTEFLIGGVPKSRADFWLWTEYEDFMKGVPYCKIVDVHSEIFTYGDGEIVDASERDILNINRRIFIRPNFIEAEAEKCGEVHFKIVNI